MRHIKSLILLLLVAVTFTSCKKDEPLQPQTDQIEYRMSCLFCYVEFETPSRNRNNEHVTTDGQLIEKGFAKFAYENTKNLKEVRFNIFTSAVALPRQNVYIDVLKNGKVIHKGVYKLGALKENPKHPFDEQWEYEIFVDLTK